MSNNNKSQNRFPNPNTTEYNLSDLLKYIQYNLLKFYKEILENPNNNSLEKVILCLDIVERFYQGRENENIISKIKKIISPNNNSSKEIIKNSSNKKDATIKKIKNLINDYDKQQNNDKIISSFLKQIVVLVTVLEEEKTKESSIPDIEDDNTSEYQAYYFLFRMFYGKLSSNNIDINIKKYAMDPIEYIDKRYKIKNIAKTSRMKNTRTNRNSKFKLYIKEKFGYEEYKKNGTLLSDVLFDYLIIERDIKVYVILDNVNKNLELYKEDKTIMKSWIVYTIYNLKNITTESDMNKYEILRNEDNIDIHVFYRLLLMIIVSIRSEQKFCSNDIYEKIIKITYSLRDSGYAKRHNQTKKRFEMLSILLDKKVMGRQYLGE